MSTVSAAASSRAPARESRPRRTHRSCPRRSRARRRRRSATSRWRRRPTNAADSPTARRHHAHHAGRSRRAAARLSRAAGDSTCVAFCSVPVAPTTQPCGTVIADVVVGGIHVELRLQQVRIGHPAVDVVVHRDLRIPVAHEIDVAIAPLAAVGRRRRRHVRPADVERQRCRRAGAAATAASTSPCRRRRTAPGCGGWRGADVIGIAGLSFVAAITGAPSTATDSSVMPPVIGTLWRRGLPGGERVLSQVERRAYAACRARTFR